MIQSVLKLSRILFIASYFIFHSNQVSGQEMNGLITKMCLKGFHLEMSLANKKPPKDMGRFTCNCFLKLVSEGNGISTAQSICKEEASKRFNL